MGNLATEATSEHWVDGRLWGQSKRPANLVRETPRKASPRSPSPAD